MNKLAEKIMQGDRRSLAKAITLLESTRPDHRKSAELLLSRLMHSGGKALRIGITGAPGVGKSTFIEALGKIIVASGHRLAVLAIDPSSTRSGGSILGDKTRMESLSRHPDVFIRPSPAGTTTGGVARASLETVILCEAAGFDVIMVETVGTGQSETRVADMTDMFLLLLSAGGGDELQGIKRGVMELADLVIINKADGPRSDLARQTARDHDQAIRLIRPRHPNWKTPVKTCSALQQEGLEDIWKTIEHFHKCVDKEQEEQRSRQAVSWMWRQIGDELVEMLRNDADMKQITGTTENEVRHGRQPASRAARHLAQTFLEKHKGKMQ